MGRLRFPAVPEGETDILRYMQSSGGKARRLRTPLLSGEVIPSADSYKDGVSHQPEEE